jgi:glycosyltransferase involved in cell wall biosynthesis
LAVAEEGTVTEVPPGAERRGGAPTVSVVLPTYRRPDLLERAVASVASQTFADWELLVVDDNGAGTPDQRRTATVMALLGAKDARVVYVVHEHNRGACAARNTGIERARGELVAFLDDDDAWYPEKLALQTACFQASDPAVALVYGSFRRVDERGATNLHRADGRAHVGRNLLMRNGIGTTSVVMCRRAALLAVGGFDDRLPSMQDYDLYVRLAQRFPFAWVPEPLLDKHRHPGDTIGKGYDGIVRANQIFYDKHRQLFEDDRVVHHHRLRWFADQALLAGRIGLARRLLWRAWRQRPRKVGDLLLAMTVNRPMVDAYRAWLRARRRLRSGGRHGVAAVVAAASREG